MKFSLSLSLLEEATQSIFGNIITNHRYVRIFCSQQCNTAMYSISEQKAEIWVSMYTMLYVICCAISIHLLYISKQHAPAILSMYFFLVCFGWCGFHQQVLLLPPPSPTMVVYLWCPLKASLDQAEAAGGEATATTATTAAASTKLRNPR